MYEHLNEETKKLIAELDSVASWYEELIRCSSEINKSNESMLNQCEILRKR